VTGTGVLVAAFIWIAWLPWRGGRRRLAQVRSPARRQRCVPTGPSSTIELAVILDLLSAGLCSGVGIPRALDAVGQAIGGNDGTGLRSVGAALVLGVRWDTAWDSAPDRFLRVAAALRPAWVHGAAPREALRVAGAHVIQEAHSQARSAAGRLGVQLVLPLGLCLLPAFILIGLVPVLISLGEGLTRHT
jgi:pilus assembly protein TadC